MTIRYKQLSLRTKLILTFLVIIVIGGLLSLIFGYRLVKGTLIGQAQNKVKHDLSSARLVFTENLNDIRDIVSLTAAREGIRDAVAEGRTDILQKYLNRVRTQYGLDILTLTDSRGKVLIRTRNPEVVGDDESGDTLVRQTLNGGIHAGPQIVPRPELLKESRALADQATMQILPTPMAAQRPETEETSGLMLEAAAGILSEDGRLLAVLYGGILLNRNYEIVDKVKELVFKGEKYKGAEIGTATIFQNDLRISTNVKNRNGERAVGTRLSHEVQEAVLVRGQSWIARAFVVKDWYITAYEPIFSPDNMIIGILYVGMLEKPYLDTTNRVMLTFSLLAGLFVLFLLVMLYFSTGRIINPLQQMVVATQEIARGDLSHKVEVHSQDEIGRLADSFNRMTDNLKEANEKLIDWTRTLEKRVEERTSELREMQAHLVQSEKLASLGKLAAGIAHEINNPLGGILIYSHLILEDIPPDTPQHENLKKVVKETTRCKDIVKGLLEFARPKEPEMVLTNISEVVERALAIVERQALFQNITIRKEYAPLPKVVADASQLQQVFMNIILNAAEAMAGCGTLTIRTVSDEAAGLLRVEFTDTGHGIKPENMKRLFEPFFTTKEVGQGTGLGLAISYSIVQKHEGDIQVRSEPGKGATFAIHLPLKQEKASE
jgi:two-component system NtrC family sensor kinase